MQISQTLSPTQIAFLYILLYQITEDINFTNPGHPGVKAIDELLREAGQPDFEEVAFDEDGLPDHVDEEVAYCWGEMVNPGNFEESEIGQLAEVYQKFGGSLGLYEAMGLGMWIEALKDKFKGDEVPKELKGVPRLLKDIEDMVWDFQAEDDDEAINIINGLEAIIARFKVMTQLDTKHDIDPAGGHGLQSHI